MITLKRAAEAVGVSKRTVERAVKAGDLPAQKQPLGGRDVWLVDGADLAAWAQSRGLRLSIPGLDNAPQTTPQLASGAAVSGNHTAAQKTDTQPTDYTTTPQATPQLASGAASRGTTEVDSLRERIRELEAERDYLRRMLDQALRALPPARMEQPAPNTERRRSWWARLTGRGE